MHVCLAARCLERCSGRFLANSASLGGVSLANLDKGGFRAMPWVARFCTNPFFLFEPILACVAVVAEREWVAHRPDFLAGGGYFVLRAFHPRKGMFDGTSVVFFFFFLLLLLAIFF